jgi:glutamate 5-kinase
VIPTIATAQRIVVKIGSALVVDEKMAAPRAAWLDSVAADIQDLRERGTDVIVVSSGAIALARRTLGLTQRRLKLEEKQAAAAVGQIRLAQAWAQAPPLPERPRDPEHIARPALRPGDQRERHRRDRRNPLRGQ